MQFWSNMKQVESWQIASLSFLDAPLNCKIVFKAQRNLSFTVQSASSCAVANSWVEKVRPGQKTTHPSLNMCSCSLAFKALSLLSRRSWPGLNESNVKVILIVFSHLSFKKKKRERNSTLQNTEYLPAVEQKVAEAATGDRSCKRAQRRLGRERNHIIEGEDMLNTVFQSHCRTEEALSCAVSSLSFSHLSFFPDAVNFLF